MPIANFRLPIPTTPWFFNWQLAIGIRQLAIAV